MTVVLDTHAVFWLLEGHPALGRRAREVIQDANKWGNVFVSAISFWEVAMLTQKGRLGLAVSPAQWRQVVFEQDIREIEVSGDIGIAAGSLPDFHGDPADRIIAASALRYRATLVTADRKILDWPGPLPRLDART